MNAESMTVESRCQVVESKAETGMVEETYCSKQLVTVKLRNWVDFSPDKTEAVNINGQWFIPLAKDCEPARRLDLQWEEMGSEK